MYSGYLISEKERSEILKRFKPRYSDVICHHITEKFPCSADDVPQKPKTAFIYGYVTDNHGIEALLVSLNGNALRSDGSYYHITLSLDRKKGYKPVDSNSLIKDNLDDIERVTPMELSLEPKVFR